MNFEIRQGDALEVLRTLPAESVDAVVTDPPYPEVSRDYGRMTVGDWRDLMHAAVGEMRRVLQPRGSAVLVLQPNSERVGRMRPWLWEFMAWAASEWNQVQDAWWWNHAALPTVHVTAANGLMRPSVKCLLWLGDPGCYRDQASVLWIPSEAQRAESLSDRALRNHPSGHHVRRGRIAQTAQRRNGVTPFNLLPIAATDSISSSGAAGHGAGTPDALCDWWVRYISRPGDLILDPFAGGGTVGVAALRNGRRFLGVESSAAYCEMARRRIAGPLFADAEGAHG